MKSFVKYEALVRAVERGSFTKASEEMGYTQSAVSKMIQELEGDWGIRMLERNRHEVRLTSEGREIYPYVLDVLGSQERLNQQINDIKGIRKGKIRIGTITSITINWLPEMIGAFHKDYPDIEFDLKTADYQILEEMVYDGRVDMAFIVLPVKKDLDILFKHDDEYVAVLPENHPLARLSRFPREHLSDDVFLSMDTDENRLIENMISDMGIELDVKVRTVDEAAILRMVEKGMGISILSSLHVKDNMHNIVSRSFESPITRTIAIAVKNKESMSPLVSKFMEYVKYINF